MEKSKILKNAIFIILIPALLIHCRHKPENIDTQFADKPGAPLSIQTDHKNLLAKIQKISLYPDSTGRTALKLFDLMQHHFAEEEDYVLPQLSLLPLLASGSIPEERESVIKLSDKLKSQLVHLNAEHQLISAFTEELIQSGRKDHPDVIDFERELHNHANIEEEVLFPASILIGEYLKLRQE